MTRLTKKQDIILLTADAVIRDRYEVCVLVLIAHLIRRWKAQNVLTEAAFSLPVAAHNRRMIGFPCTRGSPRRLTLWKTVISFHHMAESDYG